MFLREDLLPNDKQYLIKFLNQNYDYCYLDSMFYWQQLDPARIIITGSSHGLDAFNPTEFSISSKIFAMHTQDIYYDCLTINKLLERKSSMPSTWIFTLGYYSLYYDLSKTSHNYRCYDVYQPLFSDLHHAQNLNSQTELSHSEDITNFYHDYFREYPYYYGPAVSRVYSNSTILKQGGWSSLSAEQRDQYAYERVMKHNKHIKYSATLSENESTLRNTMNRCDSLGINMVCIIPPFSQEYLKYINPTYETGLLSFLESLEYPIDYIDMNQCCEFETDDFIDSDHMSDKGANKATKYINSWLSLTT